jgi:hypothetical protein
MRHFWRIYMKLNHSRLLPAVVTCGGANIGIFGSTAIPPACVNVKQQAVTVR